MKIRYSLLLIFLIALVWGCGDQFDHQTLKFSGTLELTEHALGAKTAGGITTLTVEEGDAVKQGQLLATLDRYEQARKDHERLKNLFDQGGATQQSLEYAALTMEDQQIIAPVDGVVLVKVHEMGETVQAGSPIIVVGDRSKLWVKIFVPEGKINRIHMDQPATLTFDGLKQTFRGRVSFIAPQAEFTPRNVQTQEERITQVFAVKVVLVDPPINLRPGVAADVTIETQEGK